MYSSYHMLTFAFPPFGPKHHSHCIAYCCGHVWLGPFNGATSLSILSEHISVLFCLHLCDNLKCTNARTHTALERSVWLCLGYTVSHRMYILWFHEIEALSWLSDWFYWRRLCVMQTHLHDFNYCWQWFRCQNFRNPCMIDWLMLCKCENDYERANKLVEWRKGISHERGGNDLHSKCRCWFKNASWKFLTVQFNALFLEDLILTWNI